MNKNLQKDLTALILIIVSVLLVIYSLWQAIVKGRFDAAAFFLLAGYVLYPFEIKSKM